MLERIVADDFLGMHQDGNFLAKSDEIAQIKSRKCKVESDHLEDVKVRVFGHTAVLYGRETFTVKCPDKVVTGTYVWTGTWLKRGGRWQIIAGQESRVPPRATESKPSAASGASTTGAGGLPLRSYEFDVVTVDSTGSITNRRRAQARSYEEDVNGVALEMTEISGGMFLMGTTEAGADQVKREYERNNHKAEVASKQSRWEVPQHVVSVPTFYMGKFEVTQAQWRVVSRLPKVNKDLLSDPSNFKFGNVFDSLPVHFKGDSLPVQQVSWEDAIEFCQRLSRATGRTYRLPTEAEWEYAARGGTTTAFYLGETITPELVNYDGNRPYGSAPKETSRQTTTPVGSLAYPNAFGLYDMAGNVLEWSMDRWHESYDGAPTGGSSWEAAGDTERRVARGGSYYHDGNHSRSAMRVPVPVGVRSPSLGFRVVAVARAR